MRAECRACELEVGGDDGEEEEGGRRSPWLLPVTPGEGRQCYNRCEVSFVPCPSLPPSYFSFVFVYISFVFLYFFSSPSYHLCSFSQARSMSWVAPAKLKRMNSPPRERSKSKPGVTATEQSARIFLASSMLSLQPAGPSMCLTCA
mmetsp:Transcript_10138/g.33790  ORF Transcript_10138/g.33790 Transcript_10138/m.33790 type:complete len:146 (-) Transcript_10138:1409-1846(-)